ncbi:MAG: hypothetical protein AAF641_02985 [Pseudomonadota bacterium]
MGFEDQMQLGPRFWASTVIALGSAITAALAIVIYVEVKRIRKIEWVTKANDSWNQFNFSLVNSGSSALFETFVQGQKTAAHEAANLNAIVFSYLNIIYSVWVAKQQKIILGDFAEKMLNDHFKILQKNKQIVEPLLATRGYPDKFKDEVFKL